MNDCPLGLIAKGWWYCPQCHWLYYGPKAPRRNCPNSPGLRPAADKLGISWSDVAHYAQALARWTAAGFPTRSAEEVARILETICEPCEHYRRGRCAKCGCRVTGSKVAVVNKIKMATETCPAGKW